MTTVIRDVVCPFCGSLCDDLEVTLEEGAIGKIKNGCALSRSKFNHLGDIPQPQVAGQPVTLPEALEEGGRILRSARHPLIYGLSSTTCEAQRAAVALAEKLGASIDSTSSVCHGPSTLAKQMVGIPSCTLGEVKNRADLVVFWGCNPAEAHPRHMNRYSLRPEGQYISRGREGRTMVAVDVRRTATMRQADHSVMVPPNGDLEVLTVLRALVNQKPVHVQQVHDIPLEELEQLAQLMQNASYGVLFFGMGLTMSRGSHYNVRQALRLVQDLNEYNRFSIIPMRGHGNVAGSEHVLTWQTGYPFAVNFSRGYPRYGLGEFTAVDLLRRREVDAALVVAADPGATFPRGAARVLQEIPTVVIDPHWSQTAELARVFIPSAPAGIAASGTMYRMDLVPLPLRKIVDYPWPEDRVLLESLAEEVSACSLSVAVPSMTP